MITGKFTARDSNAQLLKQILTILKTMPSLQDLQTAVDEAKVEVLAAVERDHSRPVLEVPQGIIDEVLVIKSAAETIALP